MSAFFANDTQIIFNLIGNITDASVDSLVNALGHASLKGVKELRLQISSTGGSMWASMTAYNFLRNSPFRITTHNVGDVASCANILYLAGDIRLASSNSCFFLHNLAWDSNGHFPYSEVRDVFNSLAIDIERYASVFAERTKTTVDIRACLSGKSMWFDAEGAYREGITTVEAAVPPQFPTRTV